MAKVSIIVPAYNESLRIKKCIDSLLSQTYKDIEILVIDDGSTDSTVAILEEYHDDRLKVISKPNGGQGSARNVGIKKANGEYLMFVDSDDYVSEKIVEKLVKNIEDGTNIAICNLYKVYGETLVKFNNLEHFCDDNIYNFMLSHPGPVGRLYKKNLFIENNIFFVEGLINEDLGTIPLLGIYAKKINFIDDPLYYYVIHENSTTMQTTYTDKLNDIFKIMEHLTNEFSKRSGNKYDDVLEYLYIEHLLYSASLKFVNFGNIGFSQIKKIISIMKDKYPNWYKNSFYKEKSIKFKIVCHLVYNNHLRMVRLLNNFRKWGNIYGKS